MRCSRAVRMPLLAAAQPAAHRFRKPPACTAPGYPLLPSGHRPERTALVRVRVRVRVRVGAGVRVRVRDRVRVRVKKDLLSTTVRCGQ